jgi:hypothetical protein
MIPKTREIRPDSKTDITTPFFDTDHKSFIKKVRLSTIKAYLVPHIHASPYPPTATLTWPHPAMGFAAPSPCALSDCPQFNRNCFSTPVTNTKSKELNHKNPYLDSETKVFHIWRTHQTETVTETSMLSNTIVAIMFKFKAKKKPFVFYLGVLDSLVNTKNKATCFCCSSYSVYLCNP